MPTLMKIQLWKQSKKMAKLEILQIVIEDEDQDFWIESNHFAQAKMIEISAQSQILDQDLLSDLLQILPCKDLCLTISMHDLTTKHPKLIAFLSAKQLDQVESFIKFGTAIKSDNETGLFIDEMIKEKYEGFL